MKRRRLSGLALSGLSGVSASMIYQMLRGEKNPTVAVYRKLLNALDVEMRIVKKGKTA